MTEKLKPDAYNCHKCHTRHSVDNVVAYCASCVHEMSEVNPVDRWREDGIMRDPKQGEIDALRAQLAAAEVQEVEYLDTIHKLEERLAAECGKTEGDRF